MSSLRESAIDLIKQVPEDKLYYIVQIIRDVNNLYGAGNDQKKETAFANLETMRRSAPNIDYDRELADYREGKYAGLSASHPRI